MTTFLLVAPLVVLCCAVYSDLRYQRIPNLLTFSTLGIGLWAQALAFGGGGVLEGSLGLCAGLAVLMPLYMLGGLGAGDVKLMGALGVFLGPSGISVAAVLTLLAGGVMGLLVWLHHQHLPSLVKRYGIGALASVLPNARQELLPHGATDSIRFPYALAIAVGTIGAMWLFTDIQRLFAAQV